MSVMIIQLSDVHLQSASDKIWERLESLISAADAHITPDVDCVLLCGSP